MSRPTAQDAARRLIVLKYVIVNALVTPPRDLLKSLLQKWDEAERQRFRSEAEPKRDQFWHGLRQAGLWECASPWEREYAQATVVTMTAQQKVNASWRMEAAQVLMWALKMLPQLPPYDTVADHDFLKTFPTGNLAGFIQSAELRPPAEINRARSDAEFWHWRSRTRQLIDDGAAFPDDESKRAAGFRTFDDIVRFSARKGFEKGTLPACIDDDFPAKGKAYRDLSEQEWSEVTSITIERHFALNWLCGFAPGNHWDETPTDT